ncbi:MAG: RNA polymerase sigma-70 factor [Chitinophagaceae bacterium]|nr:RNA polymerase sigma-70 factor [Chitinophagaceae bacterium]MCW5928264.1 RNA polymerase sigma-70 factor [Chitinophagaceae bacterium]
MLKAQSTYYHEPELIRRFAAGEPAAFRAVYKQLYLPVFRFVQQWVGNTEDAEELAADTFVKLWNNRDRFETLEYVRAFLHVTARNGCINFLKQLRVKTARQQELEKQLSADTEPDFVLQEIRQELMKLVYAEVEQMPKKMKEVFLLSYSEGLKPSEIALRLNLRVQTVQNQKANAIRLLKIALSDKPILIALLIWLETGQSVPA